ncbi:IPExxxVDY family protein [Pontibacter oryzae]|uniref:IPExxxVDY family protein n=1 Tax=Pontibacter oryzae TaxID=2304593 RepID=A0A399RUH8_9BACT|nr:IPExxxVDY family protein [Pontibacter oryzae]RIJ33512.1 IPExxxVDY family protein [Pontibacter oryzae]
MTKHRLDIAYDYSFDVYGLVSSGRDYKLAWALNKLLHLRLTKQQDLCYELPGIGCLEISNYQFATEHSEVRLFRNKALGNSTLKKPFLLPDIKEYDYVLQITGAMQQLYPSELINRLRGVPLVQYVKKFDPLTLKFKENLIF